MFVIVYLQWFLGSVGCTMAFEVRVIAVLGYGEHAGCFISDVLGHAVSQKYTRDFVCLFKVQDILQGFDSSQITSNVAHQCIKRLQFFQLAFIRLYFIFLQLHSQFKMVVGQSQGFFIVSWHAFPLDPVGFCLA